MRWHISVFSADMKRLLFVTECRDRAEALSLAQAAQHLRPGVQIFLRDHTGRVIQWEGQPAQ